MIGALRVKFYLSTAGKNEEMNSFGSTETKRDRKVKDLVVVVGRASGCLVKLLLLGCLSIQGMLYFLFFETVQK